MPKYSSSPILIVDKEGTLGQALAERLQQSHIVVFVSRLQAAGKNIIPIPFIKKIPTIPDNSFSTIFIIYSGEKELEEAFSSFIKKSRETNAQLILITSVFHYKDQLSTRLTQLYEKSQIIVVGDIFEPSLRVWNTPVNSLLFQAKHHARVELTGSGLDILFPIALCEAIDAIVSVAFTIGQLGQTYAVLPPHPLTQLSFARMLRRKLPLLSIDFAKYKQPGNLYHLPSKALPVLEDYLLEKRLAELDMRPPRLPRNAVSKKKKQYGAAPKQKKRPFLLIISLLFFVLALPFLVTLSAALAGGLFLKQAEGELDHGQIESGLKSMQTAEVALTLADETAMTLEGGLSLIGLGKEVQPLQTMIHTGNQVVESGIQLLKSALKIQSLVGSSQPQSKAAYLDAINQLKEGISSFQEIQAEGSLPKQYKDQLSRLQQPISLVANLVDASPTLLGFDGIRHYLILFQNNFELRPGGGFIGSYALVTLDGGSLADLTIHNVYDADGRLTAHVQPPFQLQRFMGAPHWFLRDSNFDPGFPQSASQAASFLKLETGENVDGVIGIDVSFLSSLLRATGPIMLPDYQQKLSSENFYLLTESQSQNNFFPGSTQKQDFLRSAEQELLTHIQKKQFSYQKMATVLSQALAEKHLLFTFPDAAMQKLFSVNNLSGDIAEQRSSDPTAVLDTLGINEGNIGQNKSNYYLKRGINQQVTIDGEGSVTEEVTYTYTNSSTKADQFGGDYKAYVRLITPSGSQLTGVSLDGKAQVITPMVTNQQVFTSKLFKAPTGLEVDQVREQGRQLFGLLLEVPQGQTRKLSFTYTLAAKAPIDQPKWQYNLQVLKQPGTLSDPYTLSLSYPIDAKVFSSSLPVSDLGGKLLFESSLAEDRLLTVSFVQR